MAISPEHEQTALTFGLNAHATSPLYQLLFLADFAAAKVLIDSILIGLAAQMVRNERLGQNPISSQIQAIVAHIQASLDEVKHYPLWFEYVKSRDMEKMLAATFNFYNYHGHDLISAYQMSFYTKREQ